MDTREQSPGPKQRWQWLVVHEEIVHTGIEVRRYEPRWNHLAPGRISVW